MKYFIIAGGSSGDLHASCVMKQLLRLDENAEFRFFGGDRMARYGGEPVVHIRDMAYMGFVNVIAHLPEIAEIRRKAEREIMEFGPDHLILVDYPGFNLRFAEFVKKHLPEVTIHYYIAPKLWVWKEWRLKAIKKYVDRMYSILPFETEWFGKRGYKVEYVGNPSVDAIASFRKRGMEKDLFREVNGLDGRPVIALLAGSRMQEIKGCLKKMAGCAEAMKEYQFVVAAAPNVELERYREILGEGSQLKIIQNATYELLSIATAAVVNSGTATLEAALFRVPQVVVYDLFAGRLVMMFRHQIIRTEHVSLVNIIAQREVVKELLCQYFTKENTIRELKRVLGEKRGEILNGYEQIIRDLGPDGAAERVAKRILGETGHAPSLQEMDFRGETRQASSLRNINE